MIFIQVVDNQQCIVRRNATISTGIQPVQWILEDSIGDRNRYSARSNQSVHWYAGTRVQRSVLPFIVEHDGF